MDQSAYDVKAWQTYYESQGYDFATAASYAYYAYSQAQAQVAQAPVASSSSSADWYASQSAPIINPWDEVPQQQQQQASAYGVLPPQEEYSEKDVKTEPEGGKTKGKRTTVIRKGGGKMWDDETLTEWDPKWFRLFVSDVSNDCTEKVLTEAFSKYKTFQKAKVIKDRLSNKSKYAFLAFSDPEDFLLAWKQMDGKYVGNRPIRLSKATTAVRSVEIGTKKAKMFDKAAGKGGVGVGARGRVL